VEPLLAPCVVQHPASTLAMASARTAPVGLIGFMTIPYSRQCAER